MWDGRFRSKRFFHVFSMLLGMILPGAVAVAALPESRTDIEFGSVKASVSEGGEIELFLEGGAIRLARMALMQADEPVAATRIVLLEKNALEMTLAGTGAVLRLGLEPTIADGTLPAGVRLALTPVDRWPQEPQIHLASKALFMTFPLSGRAKRDPASRITFAASGQPLNLLADTLFDVETDRALFFTGPVRLTRRAFTLPLGPEGSSITVIEDFYRKGRGLAFYAPMDRNRFHKTPCGWCSWYYYYLNINEEEMRANTDWLAENLKAFGLEYVQLDDGFQLLAPDGEQAESWVEWNQKFPDGHRMLASYIHDRGFKAGLWLTPFSQGSEALVEAHPDWFLRNAGGDVVKTFKGALTLDATNDAALEGWFVPLFEELAGSGAWDYFKIDGQTTVMEAYREHKERFHTSMSPEAAYRSGLEAIRNTISPGRFLLNCWGTVPEGIGLVNGARTGGDVFASWRGILPAKEATRAWYYTHNVCWHVDPDVLCVRPPLTLDQARLWASLMGLTGQLLMASDKMYALPEERVDILKCVYPVQSIYPMDFYPLGAHQLDIIDLKIDKQFHKWDVVGLFNWDREDRTMDVTFDELGLEKGSYLLYDFWKRKFLGMTDDGFSLVVPGQGCRVVSVTKAAPDRPTLIATTRHITMGGVDLMSLEWDHEKKSLTGASGMLVKDEPYVLAFYIPENHQQIQFAFSKQARPEGQTTGHIQQVEYKHRDGGLATWEIQFIGKRLADSSDCGRPVPRGEPALTPSTIRFAWEVEGEAPAAYRVERDGAPARTAMEGEWVESGLEPNTAYTFTVTVLPLPGQRLPEAPSFSLVLRTAELPPPPPEPGVHLTDLEPLASSQGWGNLGIDTSTDGNPLTIGGMKFERGVGTHAKSEIEYEVKPEYRLFTAFVGVDEEAAYGSVVFEVYLDGEKVFTSPLLHSGDPAHPVTVPVEGKKRMRLVVTDGGDDIHYDHADWARAGFVLLP